jgi:tRNA (mo5U34)-methyltransferase
MNRVHRERWLRIGPVELGLSIPVATDRRLARSGLARRIVRPLLGRSGRAPLVTLPPDSSEPLPERRPETTDLDPGSYPLIDRVARLDWYHTIDLPGRVTTPGVVDYRRQLAGWMLPESLAGKRCLDVMTKDGFWAFEMERRGAAEVIAVDVARASDRDMPASVRRQLIASGKDASAGVAFHLAHEALGSHVVRREMRIYDLSPEVLGRFDFVFAGDVLLSLRDPQLALDRMRSVCAGVLHLAESHHTGLESFGETCLAEYPLWSPTSSVWWYPSANTIQQMLRAAGFDGVAEVRRFDVDMPGASSGSRRRARVLMRATVPAGASNGSVHARHLSASR